MTDKKGAPAPLSRKAAQRERDKASGVRRLDLRLSPDTAKKLEQAAKIRGGVRGEYTAQDYLEELIAKDFDALMLQLEQLRGVSCKCGRTLPAGCGGFFRGEGDCFHSIDHRLLMLSEPRRLAPLTQIEFNQVMGIDE